jgi:GTP cyclohydrolase IA
MAIDKPYAVRALRSFLQALGPEVSSDGEVAQTPERVVDAFERDILSGYGVDVRALLQGAACENRDDASGPVVVHDIDVSTMCPHHLMPAHGVATVAYLPGETLVGIGAIARVVDAFARRLTLQETIGKQVVSALCEHGGARAAYCRLSLTHTCLSTRGARQARARVVTVARAGEASAFLEAAAERAGS